MMLMQSKRNHGLLLKAMVAGVARWEPFYGQKSSGEICVGGIRYCTCLDRFGCPIISESVRFKLQRAVEAAA